MDGEDDDFKLGEEMNVAAWLIVIFIVATTLAMLVAFPIIRQDVPIEAFMLCGAIVGFYLGRYMP